tara:strand:+ start:270 stop:617 length:348 start_codon:yes stop_codon:yes gene_type:complete
MTWKDILKYKATKSEKKQFFEKYPRFDNDEDRKKIKKHALAWNKAHVKGVALSYYDALENFTHYEKMDLDSALRQIQSMYSAWEEEEEDGMEAMERRRERSADAYFSGGGYNTGD